MTPPSARRRRRKSSMTCSGPHRRHSSSNMATAAMSLLMLSHSLYSPLPFTTPVDAFTPPLSTTRLPRSSIRTQFLQTSELVGCGDSASSSYAAGTALIQSSSNKPLSRLTHQQEVSLLRELRSHPATLLGAHARQTLMLHNLPLVQSIVTKTLRSRPHLQQRLMRGGEGGGSSNRSTSTNGGARVGAALTRDDLLHEGTIGLAEAIDRYDLTYANVDGDGRVVEPTKDSIRSSASGLPRGARLGTYATYWIRARILRAIQSREHAIRFPEHVLQASHRLVKTAKDMGLEWNVVLELADYDVISVAQKKLRDELRDAAGIRSDSLFREAVRVRTMSQTGSTPFESWMSPSPSLTALVGDEHDELPSQAGQDHIRETLSKFLIPREVEVLSLRYGLVAADVENEGRATSKPQVFRDYEAEAEEDLFGPNGMLSHYSASAKENIIYADGHRIPPSVKEEVAEAMGVPRRSKETVTPLSPPPTLLPFKEIGKRMQFSGEYCRRTCTEALNKLTSAVEDGRLAESDFLLGW